MLYTKIELLEDIYVIPEKCANDTPEREIILRDFKHKLKVLQSVFFLELPPYDFNKDNMDKIKETLETHVQRDEFLFGYTYLLSSNTNFDYSWNYLRKQIDKYVVFLFEAYRFISFVLKDINVINADLCGNKDLHIVFNELFDVTFMGDEPFVKTTVIWENFYQINKLKNGYYISVKIDKTTLLTFYRKYSNELNPNLSEIKQILAAVKEQTDKNKV